MAKCDEGYLCTVCGREVESIRDSDLYLRYVIGELDPEKLHTSAERHLSCNPVLAQFIDDPKFQLRGDIPQGFAAAELDPQYVADRQDLVTRGWQRLCDVAGSDLAIVEYPLPEARQRWTDERPASD